MPFTQYLYKPEYLTARVDEVTQNLKINRGMSDMAGFALGIIASRLAKDPRRYLDYGPYWWALKDLLIAAGYDLGSASDSMIKKTYIGATPQQTIVAADEFRNDYLKSQFIYSNKHMLDDANPEWMYVLFDADMEQRAKKRDEQRA